MGLVTSDHLSNSDGLNRTQYEVRSISMEIRKNSNEIQKVFVTIALGRQFLGVLLNVIIPTIVLLIISYSTNFYKDDYFESVIAINLTTMLVIVTLFVSVCIQKYNPITHKTKLH